jgi:hypothetical protein
MSEIPIRRVSEPYDGRLSRTVRRALRRQGLIITSYRSLTLSIMVFSSILFLKIGDLNLTSYYLYRYAFFLHFLFLLVDLKRSQFQFIGFVLSYE